MPRFAHERWDDENQQYVFDAYEAQMHWARAYVDNQGIVRLRSNDAIPLDDILSDWRQLGIQFDWDKTIKARNEN